MVCFCVLCVSFVVFFSEFLVWLQTLVCDVMCVETKGCIGLKIVVVSCLMLECESPHALVFSSAVYVCCLCIVTMELKRLRFILFYAPPPTQEWKELNTNSIHSNLPSVSESAT